MSAEMIDVLGKLMPILEKYNNVTPEFVDITVKKYNEGVVIKIQSNETEISEALAEILGLISNINTSCKVNYSVEDYKK